MALSRIPYPERRVREIDGDDAFGWQFSLGRACSIDERIQLAVCGDHDRVRGVLTGNGDGGGLRSAAVVSE